VANGAPVAVEDLATDRRYDHDHRLGAQEQGFHGFLGVPLRIDGRIIGGLNIYSKERRVFTADEVSLLAAFADHASLILEKHRLFAERRRTEEALRQGEKLSTMGELLAGVAHELNNPLSVVLGRAELLQRHLEATGRGTDGQKLAAAATRCVRIVRNFLALARRRPTERRATDLNVVVREAIELLGYPLRVDGVEVVADLAEDLPTLWADADQLHQVIVNLITNAHHAMRETPGPRRLTLRTRTADGGRVVTLTVADTGPGIPPEMQSRIFEPFFTTKPAGQGTGLGLSLCHGIIEAHGGTIVVERTGGAGVTFVASLPVVAPPAAEGPADVDIVSVARRSILVVDDEPDVAAVVADVLAVRHDVEVALGGAAGLARVEERAWDVVLCDIRMPGVDGPALYRAVKSRQPGLEKRFVFLTGDALSPDVRGFLDQANAPSITKPFTADDVTQAVQRVLAGG
jgi:signal transduction histidine kinase/ActR/RegA family two-component response regulator